MSRSPVGTRIVITGALGGIGSAATDALRRTGAVVTGIDADSGPGVLVVDVRDREQVIEAMARAADAMGGIDVLVNNAGIGHAHDAGDFPDDRARATMEVNFFGAWNATAAALPFLLETRGHVVNVASGLALVDVPFAAAYAASKRALVAYSNALRVEYPGRLTVSTVLPGYIRTRIHEAPAASGASMEGLVRADTVEGAAAAIVRACLRRPRSIATSRASAAELWAARRFPRAVAAVLARRYETWRARNGAPDFLRYP